MKNGNSNTLRCACCGARLVPLAQRLIDVYGSRQEAADALDVTPATIGLWLKGRIPLRAAVRVEERTHGLIEADEVLEDARYTLRK